MSTELKYELFETELLAPLRGHDLSDDESFVASVLLDASAARPIGIKAIVKLMNGRPKGEGIPRRPKANARTVKQIVRWLRKDHEFPILSRKYARKKEIDEAGNVTAEAKPAGYWWCGNEDEMREFVIAFRKQPMDELHTLSRIVKANYPRLAGQMELSEPPAVAGGPQMNAD
jgi:hypothetical protein